MKSFILASLLVIAVSASLEERVSQFQAFKLKHGKTYKNQVEEAKRLALFAQNVQEIEEHNALYEQGLVTYKKGINKFADWSKDEIKSFLNYRKSERPANSTVYEFKGLSVPESIDWRTQGYVTGVKDQGNCGSCYSFSLTGVLEGAYYKKSGQLVSLSEQQIVDCSWGCDSCTWANYGCDGGYMEQTYPYIQQYGIESEADYGYTAEEGTCQYDASKVVTKLDSFVAFSEGENNLLEATGTIGPISIGIEATYMVYYESGIYSDTQCTGNSIDINHGVLAVGYGSENGEDYWIVKNSWGENWGENGYVRMRRGTNECAISGDINYPIIN